MLTARLQKAVNRAAELPGSSQDDFAEVLEKLLDTSQERPPTLRPELAAIVEDSMRDNATMLEYLKDK
jgi:hypothetical protein